MWKWDESLNYAKRLMHYCNFNLRKWEKADHKNTIVSVARINTNSGGLFLKKSCRSNKYFFP